MKYGRKIKITENYGILKRKDQKLFQNSFFRLKFNVFSNNKLTSNLKNNFCSQYIFVKCEKTSFAYYFPDKEELNCIKTMYFLD